MRYHLIALAWLALLATAPPAFGQDTFDIPATGGGGALLLAGLLLGAALPRLKLRRSRSVDRTG